MRKFLRIFFWSHGAPLGYLGSLSQKAVPEIFSKWVLINLSNPLRHPAPLVDPLVTKKLDMAGPWCAFQTIRNSFLCTTVKHYKIHNVNKLCYDWIKQILSLWQQIPSASRLSSSYIVNILDTKIYSVNKIPFLSSFAMATFTRNWKFIPDFCL